MTSASASEPATKKSFFKRPTWASSAPPAQSGDFFRHSDIVYDSILKEKERRREKHAQKKQAKVGVEAVEEVKENKRRKISTNDEDEEEDGRSGSETASTGSWGDDLRKAEAPMNGSKCPARRGRVQATRASPSNVEVSLNDTTPVASGVIGLDSDDDKNQPQPVVLERRVQARTSDDEVSEEEDEYVLELKQRAREKARLKKLRVDPVGNQAQVPRARDPDNRPPQSSADRPLFAQSHAKPPSPPPRGEENETIVQILITTEIPNAKSLIVNRKVSQPMQQVRQVWCSRQNFNEDMTAKVIFTWRGKRLYDTTTSMRLLTVLKEERARQMGGLVDDEDEDPSNGRIEIEAITKDMYEQNVLQKNREEVDGDGNGDAHLQDRQSHERSITPTKQEFTIVMNAQGLEALRFKVRPHTSIAKIMAAFKKMRKVDPEKTCWLVHDGDRLEPGLTVSETEIEDGDAVEVHVR
jgi:Ubiquitin-2 like Rad60 SUMO-like